ncbi:MAG: transposase [Rhodanobacteraceae bacterium]
MPGIAQHVVQRGNDRRPCFFTGIDYIRYLQDPRDVTAREGCAVHAYVLMTNHVHLLMTPDTSGRIGRTMQALGRRYVRYINDRYRRTGTLWEGRYKASLVSDARHLLQCQRYIELNPVRAKMVSDPADYRWSSFHHHALGVPDPLITPHPAMLGLGRDPRERRTSYRELVMQAIDPQETDAIRRHLQHQHIYGPDRFRRAIEAQLGRKVGPNKIGRPQKSRPDTPDLLENRL